MNRSNANPTNRVGSRDDSFEGENSDVKAMRRRSSGARRLAALVSAIGIILLAAIVWMWQWRTSPSSIAPMDAASTEQTIVVAEQAVTQDLDVVGIVGPANSVAVIAPFDGVVRERRVQAGDHVNVGDILVVMDAREITSRYREAESAFLKANMAVRDMENWESSSDVQHAKRALQSAETNLAAIEQQVAVSKGLFDQGIVSRDEYNGLVQQRDAQKSQVDGNRADLTATLARGDADSRQVLSLELENAQDRLSDLRQQVAGAKIAAAVPGIVTLPPVRNENERPPTIEVGATLQRGTPLYAVADTTTFICSGYVDEVDINRVKVGLPVTITSDALPGETLQGRIVSVSAEASSAGNTVQVPSFQIRAAFSPSNDDQRRSIRIGMSARLTLQTYSNPRAILVPPAAIVDAGKGPKVRLLKDGTSDFKPVALGPTFPQGVEVVSGLKAGDVIAIP